MSGMYEMIQQETGHSDFQPPMPSPDVPPDYLIQSGGGLSNMYHGEFGGPYSNRAERSDIYGSSMPFQRIGNPATKSSMYEGTGIESSMTPRLYTPDPVTNYAMDPYAATGEVTYTDTRGPPAIYDKYVSPNASSNDYDLIENYEESPTKSHHKSHGYSTFIILIIIIGLFIVIDLWVQSTNRVLKSHVFKGTKLSTSELIGVTIIGTALFFIILCLFGFGSKFLLRFGS